MREHRGRARGALLAVAFATWACHGASAREPESTRLIELLRLAPGAVAADVGAGEGQWAQILSEAVGASGRVFATEVDEKLVKELTATVEERKLTNVTVVLGTQSEVGLPRQCCNAVLLRMVYHHFEDPVAMRASLRAALRPGGLLAVVDINPQRHWRRLDRVPERGGHGIEPEDLVREMSAAGFDLVSRHDDWNGDDDRYCVVLRRKPADP